MLPVPFTFSGRLGRWSFFKASLLLGLSGVIIALMTFGAVPAIAAGSRGAIVALFALIGIVVLATMWISFALQARRFRDMGFDPWIAIPAWFALMLADVVLAKLYPGLSLRSQHLSTPFGTIVNLLFVLALYFWPSSDRADDDGGTAIPTARMAPSAPRAYSPAGSALAPNARRTSFGLR